MKEHSTPVPERVHPRAAFQHRDFRLFQGSRLTSVLGSQMLSVTISWQVYDITRNPLDLGYIGLALFLPAVGFSLLTGHVADRFDRRRVMMVCQSILVACSLAFLALTLHGVHSLWPIYLVLVLLGSARAFFGPASQALVPHLVPPEHFTNAVAWNGSIWQMATIVGPSLGGLILGHFKSPAVVYGLDALLSVISLGMIWAIRARTGRLEKAPASWSTLLAGIRYVFEKKIILGTVSLDLFAVLLGGAVALLPVYARDVLKVEAWGFGILRSAPAVGAAVMAIAVAHMPPMKRAGATMLGCVALFGAGTILFGLSRNFFFSVACLTVMGAADMVSVVVRHTLIQISTPEEMRGRVSAVNLIFIGASNELGEFESGVTAKWFGAVPAVILGGLGTLLVVGLWAWGFPDLRRFKRLDMPQQEAQKKG